MLRTANELNGFDGIHITKLDVLADLPTLKICVKYVNPNGVESEYFPSTLDELEIAKPIYIEMPGFGDITSTKSYNELPLEAKEYIEKIKQLTGIPILSVSIGADRKDILWLKN